MTKAKKNPRPTSNNTYIGERWAWKRIFDAAGEKNETEALANIKQLVMTRLKVEK